MTKRGKDATRKHETAVWTRKDEAVSLSERASSLEAEAKKSGDVLAIQAAEIAAGRASAAVNELSAAAFYDKATGGGSSKARSARAAAARCMKQARDALTDAAGRLGALPIEGREPLYAETDRLLARMAWLEH